MIHLLSTLPDDTQALKRLVGELSEKNAQLLERLNWFERQLFGQKSEKLPPAPSPEAIDLFNPLVETLEKQENPLAPTVPSEREIITYTRKKPAHGRNPLPAHLPRVEEVLNPPEEALICSCCGEKKQQIGEDVAEVLEPVHPRYQVRRIIRPRYACPRHGEEGVVQAKARPRFIDKGNVSESLVAQVIVDKYLNHQPLSRQEKQFKYHGIHLPVSTQISWIEGACEKLAQVTAHLREKVMKGDILYSDDTRITVLKEDNPGGSHRGYFWLYANGEDAAVFEYLSGRDQKSQQALLRDFRGYLHCDATSAYGRVQSHPQVQTALCWAHARRRFLEAVQVGDERARPPVRHINQLFRIERVAKKGKFPSQKVLEIRHRLSIPVLEKLKGYLKCIEPHALPQSSLGKALGYLVPRWELFRTFLQDGRVSLDNNLSERQLRQVVIGRKNYLFCGSEAGAQRAAILYTLIGTCVLLQMDPMKYLTRVLELLAQNPERSAEELTPAAIKPSLA